MEQPITSTPESMAVFTAALFRSSLVRRNSAGNDSRTAPEPSRIWIANRIGQAPAEGHRAGGRRLVVDRGKLDRSQATLAQHAARLLGAVGIDDAPLDSARGGRGLEAEGGHQSRVTRTTSSTEVVPACIQRCPSSRIVCMPLWIAAARSSPSPALRCTSARNPSSIDSSS